jgi:hypothetical protein
MPISVASIGCSSCPDYVIQAVSAKSWEVLDKIQRLKYLTSIFNRLIKDIANQILGDLQALVDLIPDPPVFNVTEYVNLITCPLTPLAILKDIDIRDKNSPNDPTKFNFAYNLNQSIIDKLDPRKVYENNLKPTFINKKKQVEALYDEALARIGSYDLRELKNEMDFTQRYQNGPSNPSTNPALNTVVTLIGTTGTGEYIYNVSGTGAATTAMQSAYVSPGSVQLTVNASSPIVFNDDGPNFRLSTGDSGSMYVDTANSYILYNTANPPVNDYTPFNLRFISQNGNLTGALVTVQFKDSSSSPLSIEGAVQKLRSSPQPKSPVAQIVRRYLQELYRALSGNPAQFALDIAFCMAQGAYVQAACPSIYNNPNNPFIKLANELSTWSFDGLLPSGMDAEVQRFMTIVAQAWQKVKRWEDLVYIIV